MSIGNRERDWRHTAPTPSWPGFVKAVRVAVRRKNVDARTKRGHDGVESGTSGCSDRADLLHRPHHVSMHGRFFPFLDSGFGTERSPAMIQRRVSAGSMTLSISNTEAMETALPLA